MKVELHCHTSRYSGCATATPAELLKRMAETGYEAVYLTEHDTVWSDWEIAQLQAGFPTIRVFPGIERSIGSEPARHIVILGTNDRGYLELKTEADVLKKARDEGNLTVLAHPLRWGGGEEMLQAGNVPDALEYRTGNHDVSLAGRAEAERTAGRTAVFLAVGGKPRAVLSVADPIKESARDAIRDLRAEGIEVVMLTGDNRTAAQAVARALGIEKVEAEVLPERKAEVVRKLQADGRVVAMAGDGINDAPALAAAQVGIAMGTGTDVAMESAPVTLVKGDLRAIVRARRLSRRTMRNIEQNLFFAFFYNAAGVPIAAGVLYPFFGLLLSPVIAAAAMSFSSVSVVTNSLRLKRFSAHVS